MSLHELQLKLTQRWNREYTISQDGCYVNITIDLKENEQIIDFLPKSYWMWIVGSEKIINIKSCDIPIEYVDDFHDNCNFTAEHMRTLSQHCYFQIRESDVLIFKSVNPFIERIHPIYHGLFVLQDNELSILFEHLDTITDYLNQDFPMELPLERYRMIKLFNYLKSQNSEWKYDIYRIYIEVSCGKRVPLSIIGYNKRLYPLNNHDVDYRELRSGTLEIWVKNPLEMYLRVWNRLVKDPILVECIACLNTVILPPLSNLICQYVY